MGKYHFYQDCKVMSWERDYFSVDADNYDEAVAIVRSWGCEDVSCIIDKHLCYEERQTQPDTSERLFPDENNGYPTAAIFDDDGNLVVTNAPEIEEPIF